MKHKVNNLLKKIKLDNWHYCEIWDRWGVLFSANSTGQVNEYSRTIEKHSEYFLLYLDGQLILSFLEKNGSIVFSKFEGVS